MTREDSIRQIENYPPFNEQEEKDKALILGWISNNENAFSRENIVAHITASAWVVNKDRSKVLMVYHNIYNSWSWMGGHADGETNLLSVAIKAGYYDVSHLSKEIKKMSGNAPSQLLTSAPLEEGTLSYVKT